MTSIKTATRNRLPRLVAAAQVALAVFLWWYGPLQFIAYRKAIEETERKQYPNRKIELSLESFRRFDPPPAEALSLALNFPAAELAGTLNFFSLRPLYEHAQIELTVRDVAFFCLTGVLWYWVASILTRIKARDDRFRSSSLSTLGSVCGLVFAVLIGAIAIDGLFSINPIVSYERIAPYGIAWSLVLGAYFAWQLWLQFKKKRITTSP